MTITNFNFLNIKIVAEVLNKNLNSLSDQSANILTKPLPSLVCFSTREERLNAFDMLALDQPP